MSELIDLIHATVRLEQPRAGGVSTVGTGFVIIAPGADGEPRTILVTADHVFKRMPGDKVKVGFRVATDDGDWRYAPVSVRIRGAEGEPLWTAHPLQDVAAIALPSTTPRAAVPAARLANGQTLTALGLSPGDEMMVLGYPQGFSANAAGFPILRSGRVASYPLAPASRYPTFMLDVSVYGGNSGGPVYVLRSVNGRPPSVTLTGILTQEFRIEDNRLEIGNVTQAAYVAETLSLMAGAPAAEVTPTRGTLPQADPMPSSGGTEPTAMDRLREGWDSLTTDIAVVARRAWIVVKQTVLGWITPDPRPTPL
ncbi:MAG: serine protease [Phenylobacterium sp.]|nr:serine protease [Phenylobacterium sp.]